MPRIRDALARYLPRQLMSLTREQKASAAGPLIAFQSMGRPVWAPRDYAAFAREGFMQNAIVYRSVRMIAETAASIPILLYDGEHEISDHPLLDLMRQPSRDQTTADMLESWFGFLLVSGNAYAEAVAVDEDVREIHVLRPDRMKVVPGADGWPEGYEYSVGGQTVRFGEETLPGLRPILHVKMFHPDNDHYGMSPIEAAGAAIDIHNEATNWNKALLDNAARPSGALVYAARDGHLTGEQYERLKAELEDGFQGAKHAGRPLLLEGGLDWRPLSLSPKDMDFIQAKHAAAREIALALGVPPMLLGIPGDNTYSNYQEANRSFWRHTVLPLVNRTLNAFSGWLGPTYGGGLTLKANRDEIEALTGEVDQLWARLEGVSFLTADEKRAAAGYGPLQGAGFDGDQAGREGKRFNPDQPRVPAGDPDDGQWTDGGGGSGGRGTEDSDGRVAQVRRPMRLPGATPRQNLRFTLAVQRARKAKENLRVIEPDWREPTSALRESSIEGQIRHQEAIERSALARYRELLRDALPQSNPAWSVNRLRKELSDRGFVLKGPARGRGIILRNESTGEEVRIMERPHRRFRTDSAQKHYHKYYYRYRRRGEREGRHITIPDK